MLCISLKSNDLWVTQIDINDQKSSRLFSVIGKVDSANPEILITAGSNQQEIKLSIDDVFDKECVKLHEDSDYSVSEEQIANITENKFTTPVYKNGSYSGYSKPYNSGSNSNTVNRTTNYGYNATKSTLITKIHNYSTLFTFSSLKAQELLTAFLDYFEEETLSKDTKYANDLEQINPIMDNMGMQFNATFDLISDHFGESKEEVKDNLALEDLDQDAVNAYLNGFSTPNHYN